MNDIQLARLLGLLSLLKGAGAMAAGSRIAARLGLHRPELLPAFGARDIGTGMLALTYPDTAWPIWARVAGDALDLALLAGALGRDNRRRHGAAWVAIGALGLTLADVAVATALTRRAGRALDTARRTRVRRKPSAALPQQA